MSNFTPHDRYVVIVDNSYAKEEAFLHYFYAGDEPTSACASFENNVFSTKEEALEHAESIFRTGFTGEIAVERRQLLWVKTVKSQQLRENQWKEAQTNYE